MSVGGGAWRSDGVAEWRAEQSECFVQRDAETTKLQVPLSSARKVLVLPGALRAAADASLVIVSTGVVASLLRRLEEKFNFKS